MCRGLRYDYYLCLDDDIKMASLEQLAPHEMERHLQLNAAKMKDYVQMRRACRVQESAV